MNNSSPLHIKDLNLINFTFNQTVELGTFQSTGRINFIGCTFNENVTIASDDYIWFDDECKFYKVLSISTNDQNIDLSSWHIFKDLKLISTYPDDVEIKNFIVNEPVKGQTLTLNSESNNLEFNNINADVISIQKLGRNSENLFTDIKCEHLFLNGPFDRVKTIIQRSSFIKLFVENIGYNNNSLSIEDNCSVHTFELPLGKLSQANISNSELQFLTLSGANLPNDIINIQDIRNLKSLKFQEITNTGSISLRNLEIIKPGNIGIFSSNLGKTDFIKCDFSKAKFGFLSSKVTEIFLSEAEFPNKVFLEDIINHP